MAAKSLFVSYSHKDTQHLETLKTHLKPLERANSISPWFDHYLIPGDDIDPKVAEALEKADIIVLLVSSDFLASDYCYTIEMKRALQRHDNGEARVVPVIVRDCVWKTTAPFGRLAALPTDGNAVMSLHWPDKDEAWRIVAEGIHKAAGVSGQRSAASPAEAIASPGAQKQMPTALPVKRKNSFTDKDRDDFKNFAFEQIARRFEASIEALEADLSGNFRQLDANRFTATIYAHGKKVAGFTVFMGGDSFTSDAIGWHTSDSGATGTYNGRLAVQVGDGELVLSETLNMFGTNDERQLSADEASEYLWHRFVDRL